MAQTEDAEMPKRLTKQQRSEMLELISAVNSEEITSVQKARDWAQEHGWGSAMLDWTIYSAGENMPGYLPDSPYCLFLTERSARGYCRELEREEGHKDGGYVSDYMPVTLRDVLS